MTTTMEHFKESLLINTCYIYSRQSDKTVNKQK